MAVARQGAANTAAADALGDADAAGHAASRSARCLCAVPAAVGAD